MKSSAGHFQPRLLRARRTTLPCRQEECGSTEDRCRREGNCQGRYVALVCDLMEATVKHIGEDRKEASHSSYFMEIPKEKQYKLEAINIGM